MRRGEGCYRGEGVSGAQVGALAADVADIFVPFATGGGAAVRAAARADDVAHLAKTAESASSFGKRGVDFIVTEAGEAIPVPTGAIGPKPVRSSKGAIVEGGREDMDLIQGHRTSGSSIRSGRKETHLLPRWIRHL